MDTPTVFISYSHKDEHWKDRLWPHLPHARVLLAMRDSGLDSHRGCAIL